MKGKLPSITMVFVAVAMALSLVAAVATVPTVNADPGVDSFDRMPLPSTADYQMFPDTDIWAITAADDGTVFAIVQDTSGTRWAPLSSDYRVFKSTDGGYTWEKLWAIPANEPTVLGATGLPVGIVPQPDYDDTDADNQIVFLATDDNLYRSLNGGDTFTRIVPECPGVIDPDTAVTYDLITSLDVAENINVADTYVAVVGTGGTGANGEGVFTWNEDNLLNWRDKRVGNVVKGSNYDVLAVMFSPNYTDDGVIVAILNDPTGNVVMSFWFSDDGLWNGPTLTDATLTAGPATSAGMTTADDFDYQGSPWVFAFVNIGTAGEVYAVKALPLLPAPSTVLPRIATAYAPFSDILFDGTALAGTCYVGSQDNAATTTVLDPNVIEGTSLTLWATWTPAIKSPAGSYPIMLANQGEAILAATMTDMAGGTTSGVSKQVAAATGSVYNGIGLMDDIAVSTDLPRGTFYVTMASLEASPNYADDDTVFVTTASEWYQWKSSGVYGLSLWRQAPTGIDDAVVWERLLQEGMGRFGSIPTGKTAIADPWIFNAPASTDLSATTLPTLTWVTKVDPAFEQTDFVFLMAALGGVDRIWYSADSGDTWHPVNTMPTLTTLSELGWCVVDYNTILVGDGDGWVYKTTNRGNSWSDGAFTDYGVITDLNVSPIYSEAGGSGTDLSVIAGVAYTGTTGNTPLTARTINEVWMSFDGADDDFTIVDSEMMWEPYYGGLQDTQLICMANFDADWEDNSIVYGAASGAMADWWWDIGGGAITLQDTTEVGVYRAVVNEGDTQASTWVLLYGADDFIAQTDAPEDDAIMYLTLSDLDIGPDGTIYIPFSIFLDDSVGTLTPLSVMRFTEGGMIRCLDGTATDAEWDMIPQVLGPYDGLWLMSVVPGGSNIIFSAAYDVWDWRFKLAAYDDTLSSSGPDAGTSAPDDGDTDVGTISGDLVMVALSWTDIDADKYQLQVSSDSAFTSPMTTTTSDTSATVAGLEPGVTYYWRMRATEPVTSPWSDTMSFTTVATPGTVAPDLLSPSAGAEGVSSTPTFSWSAVAGATSYQIQVATDSSFSSKVIDETTSSTAYQSGDDLDNDTYYWRVKADADWSATGVFTVGAVPGAGTPAWVWVVIVIGALLVIAVIVLILRTRRAV